jgi:anti-sigma factor RsiW
MNHPTADELLLLAYGELPHEAAAAVERHATTCVACQEQLLPIERGRVALEMTMPARRRPAVAGAALGAGLAAAAVLAGLLVFGTGRSGDADREGKGRWNPTTTWSATAGYVAGGTAMVDIDAQLTRLEQERTYGFPN